MGLKEIKQMYKLHSKFYDITRWIFIWNRYRAIKELDAGRGDSVLIVGCGTGYGFDKILSRIGDSGKIIGVDYSEDMLEKARRKVEKNKWKNIELIQADASYYKAKNIDEVLYSYSISMIPEWCKSLRNSYESLNKGGRLVIVDFGEVKIPILKQLINFILKRHRVNNKLELKKELKKYFKDAEYKEYFFGYSFIIKAIKN